VRIIYQSANRAANFRRPPDNQAILDRIDRLERKLLGSSGPLECSTHVNNVSAVVSSATTTAHKGSDSGTHGNLAFFTVESVLCWPVFEGHYRSCLNLRDLMTSPSLGSLDYLSPQSSGKGQPHMNIEIKSCSKLLDNFFSRIHIKNPVLDEKEIRQWAREISFNGIGWDTRSCLVVRDYTQLQD
jgi:hypothetical protein